MPCPRIPAAFAPDDRRGGTSPSLGPSSSCVGGAESLCRLPVPRNSATHRWLSSIVRDSFHCRACRNSRTAPLLALDEGALRQGDPFPDRQVSSHAFEWIPSRLRSDRAWGSRLAAASLRPAILRGIDCTRSDDAAWQARFGRPRTNRMLGALHARRTPAHRFPAARHQSINASPLLLTLSLLSRHTPPLDAELRSGKSSDRPVEAGAIDA